MPKCIIDGQEVSFQPGEKLIEVAKSAGIMIPAFCYHPGLSVVAQCRMCAVEIDKMPKLQTACSTAAAEGMVVRTRSDKTIQNQKSVMEFLLINHPLDCPICDQSGECDLQDHAFSYGDPDSRYTEERRTYLDVDMGSVIKKNMNRCIHCTRCIRFGSEIAGIREMVALKRGNHTDITTIEGKPLMTEYAGNYADLCPTGSLTLKDFRFKKRVWFLKKTPSICEGCSKGCNLEIHHYNDVIYRCVPRVNREINQYWLCDEGRFHFHDLQRENRVIEPHIQSQSHLIPVLWQDAFSKMQQLFEKKKFIVLLGSDLTQEELKTTQDFIKQVMPNADSYHFGTPGILKTSEDAPADRLLKRQSKTSNLNGVEKLGIPGLKKIPEGTQALLVVRAGRAILPDLKGIPAVGVGVYQQEEVSPFQVILPGLSFFEKQGTVMNHAGIEQVFQPAVKPPGQCKPISEIFMMWMNHSRVQGAA